MLTHKGQDQILVHIEEALADEIRGSNDQLAPTHFASNLRWYCEWLADTSPTARVMAPQWLREHLEDDAPVFAGLTPIWYARNEGVSIPCTSRKDRIWVINAAQLPVVDWDTATSTARQIGADVVAFEGAAQRASSRYEEYVLVGADQEVLRFERYYHDSPVCADLWNGESAFVVTGIEHAPGVVAHLLRRGWDLQSIGAMTRRFSVRWSSTPCAYSAFETDSATADDPTFSHAPMMDVHECMARRDIAAATDAPGETNMDTVPAPVDDPVSTTSFESFDLPEDDQAYLWLKRAVDVTASAAGLIALAPLLLGVAALIKLTSRGPVFFAHKRQGLGGREFFCLKFRSMTVGADAMQDALRDKNEVDGPQFRIVEDPRLTRVGGWLRRFNIDELPQLFNVLFGDMSLVGPRPSPDSENQLCPAWRRTRLSVKPGITGLWQVLRRRLCPQSDFQEWIYYDVEYARHRSLWLDWQVLLHTPIAMFAPRYLNRFAVQLERAGICKGSDRLHPIDELRV